MQSAVDCGVTSRSARRVAEPLLGVQCSINRTAGVQANCPPACRDRQVWTCRVGPYRYSQHFPALPPQGPASAYSVRAAGLLALPSLSAPGLDYRPLLAFSAPYRNIAICITASHPILHHVGVAESGPDVPACRMHHPIWFNRSMDMPSVSGSYACAAVRRLAPPETPYAMLTADSRPVPRANAENK